MSTVHTREDAIAPSDLADVDLNLLVAFDALARELNVTRAAQHVGVTQSAMSHALRRLRELFRDPLLVRVRGGMVLTPRAGALVVPLRSGLMTIGRALASPSMFDPRSARRGFRIATPDLFDVLVIPPLLERIRQQASGIDIGVVPVDERRLADQLETGEVDTAVVPQVDDPRFQLRPLSAPGLLRRTLFRDRFVCFMRADHPALRGGGRSGHRKRKAGKRRSPVQRKTLTLETYAQLSHVLCSQSGTGPGLVDELLADRGRERRVALRIPAFYSALLIVARSDLILTAPAALARLADGDLVVALPAPIPLPTHSINLVWHERFTKDPGHEWLRALLAASADQVMNG
jgi:DNA-binding transcriptional LysR family regulator